MGLLIPVGFGLAAWHTLTDGDPEEMVWTCGLQTGSATDAPNIPTLMNDAWNDNLKSLTSSAVTLTRSVIKLGPNATGPTYEASENIVGTNGGSLAPPNCAVLVKKITALGGREGRGRAYLPGISSISGSLDSGGNFSGANATTVSNAMQALFDQMLADDLIGPVTPVVLHSASSDPTQITSFVCEPKLATQRRRLRP